MSGCYNFGHGGVPGGLSPDEFMLWAMERRKQYAAGMVEAKQPQLRSKTTDNEAAVILDPLDRPPEGDTQP